MSVGADPIQVIETGYDLAGTDKEWLERVARALQPLLDGGHGVHAYLYDQFDPINGLEGVVMVDADPDRVRAVFEFGYTLDPKLLLELHADPEPLAAPLPVLDEMGVGPLPAWQAHSERWDVADYLALRTVEPDGQGLAVSGAQRRPVAVDRRTKRLWARVSAHLAAARRLRKALSEAQKEAATEEAILNPSGHLAHAEGLAKERHARDALQQAVLRQERARGRLRRKDPEAATEAWNALVTGRWSLIERFESDGRRYLVARPNEVHVRDPRALTERERVIVHLAALGKSNKLIAYELGLSLSTVATHLTAALRKLGLSSRTQLASVLMALPGQAPPSS